MLTMPARLLHLEPDVLRRLHFLTSAQKEPGDICGWSQSLEDFKWPLGGSRLSVASNALLWPD